MKNLKIYLLEYVVIIVGLTHQVLQKVFKIEIDFWNNYGDDLIAVPFIASIVLITENRLVYKNNNRVHNFYQLLFIFFLLSILFEFILPRYDSKYTTDYWDILCYIFGLIVYYLMKRGINKFNPSYISNL